MPEMADETVMRAAETATRGLDPEADKRLWVKFRWDAVEDKQKSMELGRRVFKDVPWVWIAVPGDKDNIYDQPAWVDESDMPHPMAHNARFPLQWARFKAGKTDEHFSGTMLSDWPGILRSQVEELSYLKVKTVEQLASVSDGNLQKMGPGYLALRQKARDFIEQAKNNAPMERMRAELAERDNKIQLMDALVKQQSERLAALEKLSVKEPEKVVRK